MNTQEFYYHVKKHHFTAGLFLSVGIIFGGLKHGTNRMRFKL